MNAQAKTPQPDTGEMIKHLKWAYGDATVWPVVLIGPRGIPQVERLKAGSTAVAADSLKQWNLAGNNLYIVSGATVADWNEGKPVKDKEGKDGGEKKPPHKALIESCSYLHADIDFRVKEDPDAELARVLKSIVDSGVPQPSL